MNLDLLSTTVRWWWSTMGDRTLLGVEEAGVPGCRKMTEELNIEVHLLLQIRELSTPLHFFLEITGKQSSNFRFGWPCG